MATKKKVTLDQLKAAAEDFNSFMEFVDEEGIPADDMSKEELIEEISETGGELIKDDTITAATAATLDALGVDYEATVAEEEDDPEEETKGDLELTEEDVNAMKKAELVKLAKDEEIDISKKKTTKAIRDAILDARFWYKPKEDEEPKEDEDEIVPLKGAEAKAMNALIAKVGKSRKLDDVKAIAKENKIRIPPPFLKDLKKLKSYVVGKLEDILSGEAQKPKPKKGKKEKKATLVDFFEKNVEKDFDMADEDKIVEAAKEEFPEKPYRVIGNSLYSFVKNLG